MVPRSSARRIIEIAGPVLDRAGGVVAFQLGENDVPVFSKPGIQALQPHKRRVADEILDRPVHAFSNSRT
jgi:hypothetical protein